MSGVVPCVNMCIVKVYLPTNVIVEHPLLITTTRSYHTVVENKDISGNRMDKGYVNIPVDSNVIQDNVHLVTRH